MVYIYGNRIFTKKFHTQRCLKFFSQKHRYHKFSESCSNLAIPNDARARYSMSVNVQQRVHFSDYSVEAFTLIAIPR